MIKFFRKVRQRLLPENRSSNNPVVDSPSLKIAGLSIWISNTISNEPVHHVFGNSVDIYVECNATLSNSFFQRSFIIEGLLQNFEEFRKGCIALNKELSKTVCLEIYHPGDAWKPTAQITVKNEGQKDHLSVLVELNLNSEWNFHPTGVRKQEHKVEFQIDINNMPSIIKACRKIVRDLRTLANLPVKWENAKL